METIDLKWHEVVHRVLTGRVSGRNESSDRFRQSRRHVDDRSSLRVVCLRIAAHALRAVALRFVRGQGDEFVVGSQGDGLFFVTFGWCSHERTQSTDAPNEQCHSAECGLIDSGPVEHHVITRSPEKEEEVCRLTRSAGIFRRKPFDWVVVRWRGGRRRIQCVRRRPAVRGGSRDRKFHEV